MCPTGAIRSSCRRRRTTGGSGRRRRRSRSTGSSRRGGGAPAVVAPGGAISAAFALAGTAQVTVAVLGPDGSILATPFQGPLDAGTYSYAWAAVLADGSPAPAGHYQVQVTVVDTLATVIQT